MYEIMWNDLDRGSRRIVRRSSDLSELIRLVRVWNDSTHNARFAALRSGVFTFGWIYTVRPVAVG